MESVISGDPEKTAQALAPQISAERQGLQQDQKTNAMFGNRAGGTNAANIMNQDKVHADTTNLIGSLTGHAASALLSTGESLLGTGIGGTQAAFGDAKAMQAQRSAQWNDIFKSATSVAGSVIGGLPANAGSWQDTVSNALAG